MILEYKPLFQLKTSVQRYQFALLRLYQQYRPNHCFIAKFIQGGKQAKVLSHLHNGNLADSFIYDISQTPCEQIYQTAQLQCIGSNVQKQYPLSKQFAQWHIEGYLAMPLLSHDQQPCGLVVCLFEHGFEQNRHDLQRFMELSHIIAAELNHQLAFITQQKLLDQLANDERISKRGSMQWDFDLQAFRCSSEVFNILQLDTTNTPIGLEQFLSCVSPNEKETVSHKLNQLLHADTNRVEFTFSIVSPKRKTKYLQLLGIFEFDSENHTSAVHISIQDVTANYEMNKQLRLSNFVFEHTIEAIMITDSHNNILSVNSAFEQTTGFQLNEVIGRNPSVISSGRHDIHFYRHMWNEILTKGHWKGEVFNKHKQGHIFPEELSISVVENKDGEITNFVAIFRDVSERKATEKQLSFYANNEPLTGLTNRRAFIDTIEHHISIAKRHNAPFSVIFFDVDRFKEINDIYGHQVGDKLLKGISKRISKCVRTEDIVCRYGGDEFTVLLVNTSMDQAGIVAEKFQRKLQEAFVFNEIELEITSSIGIAQFPDSGLDATTLLSNANLAMTCVKNKGRNGIVFHDNELQTKYLTKLALRNKLRQAVENGAFEVFYQPIIDVAQNKITKFESLVRWREADGSFISPGIFIPIAEEFGFIHKIGQFVLKKACSDLSKLHSLGHQNIQFSINRSISEFRHDVDEAALICQTIKDNGLPNHAIVIEITESVAMSSNIHTEQVLSELKNQGICIALDDFCTGYSSLSNLIEYHSDFLKIDKSFIDCINTEKNHRILISTLIDMATKLDMYVIAEGVEELEQLELLQQYGCHYIQGYYYSPARPIEECIELLNKPL